jgi:hypothetical protein
VKNTSGQELRTVIIKIVDHDNEIGSLVRAIKKVQKLRTAIIGAGSANLRFESGFSLELRGYCIPSYEISLNRLENRSQARKKRNNTIGEEFEEGELKNRTKNCRFSWCILSFSLFSCCVVV